MAASDTRQIDISVVVPVYRSEGCVLELLRQLTETLSAIGRAYEIILVDDASPDRSWRMIREGAASYPNVFGIRLMGNRGQARATMCGFSHARGGIVITMDDDLQHRPDQLPALLGALESNGEVDCAFGVFDTKYHAGYRNVGSRIIAWVNRRSFGLPRDARASSFCAMRRAIARSVVKHKTGNPAIAALLYSSTKRVMCVPVVHAERYAGRSNYTLPKQFRLAFDNICNVSMLPLRMVSALGFVICSLTALYVVYVLYKHFLGKVGVPGWTTVVVLVSFFSGTILLALGVIGEYMARILREVRGEPRYTVREEIESAGNGAEGRGLPEADCHCAGS